MTIRLENAKVFLLPQCRKCGCTEMDCSGCVEKTGQPCFWAEKDILCSACLPTFTCVGLYFSAWDKIHPGQFVCSMPGPQFGLRFFRLCDFVPDGGVQLFFHPSTWAVLRRLLPQMEREGRLRR